MENRTERPSFVIFYRHVSTLYLVVDFYNAKEYSCSLCIHIMTALKWKSSKKKVCLAQKKKLLHMEKIFADYYRTDACASYFKQIWHIHNKRVKKLTIFM